MLFQQLQQQSVELGWDFYGPVILFVVMLALGIPVWVTISATSAALLYFSGALPLSLIGEAFYNGANHYVLTAVPLFILTGDCLVRSGLSKKFLDVAEALTSWARGGFGSATVLVCGMFAAISGSDAAGAAAVGRMTIDRLVEAGYPRPYACALVASGACTGILIPPSIAYIVIGLVLGISVPTLFKAALIPGLLILTAILVTNTLVNRKHRYENNDRGTWGEWGSNLWDKVKSGWYAFLVPGLIFAGIFSGWLTPTEAGALAVTMTLFIGFILGTIKLGDLPSILISSAKVTGVIVVIIAASLPMAQALAIMGVPQGFVYALTSLTENRYLLILIMIVILVLAGCVMETTPNIVILAPILKPLADNIGMNEIQFCVLMITTLGVGFITPPMGLNLFVVSGLTGESILKISKRAIPFVLCMLAVTLLIAYIPAISTSLLPANLK